MNAHDSTSVESGRTGGDDLARLREEARAWATSLKLGQPTTADVAAFHQWRNQSPRHAWAWSETCKDWAELGRAAQGFEARYPDKIVRPARSASPRRDRRLWLGAAAAAFGSLAVTAIVRPPLGLWPSWNELGADYRTAKGEQRDLTLDERLHLVLNTQTSVALQRSDGVQQVSLIAGEAAISSQATECEVLAAASLRVSDGDFEVRRLDDGRVRVRCFQGNGRLHHAARTVALAGGQELYYDRAHVGVPTPLASAASAWRQGWVVFDNLPLADAIEEINRYRAGRVVLMNDALAHRRFSAKFQVHALDDAIRLMEQVLGVQARRAGDLVVLT